MGKFDSSWNRIDKIIAFGLGQVGKKYIGIFNDKFEIKCIVDNACTDDEWLSIPIVSTETMLKTREKEKIVVFAARTSYFEIKDSLEEFDLKEYLDFCKFDEFVTEWYWQIQNMNCLREVHTSINTDCTFICKNCNMFMPYYNDKLHYTLNDLEPDLKAFFDRIDYVFIFSLLGGEPFLNKDISAIIKYIHDNYMNKIGRIEVVSNGSLIPTQDAIHTLKECGCLVRLSDYTSQIQYEKRLKQLEEILSENGIEYVVEKSLKWTDFVFPEKRIEFNGDIRKHMLCCAPLFHGLNDGKFYYCHVSWSAEKAGLITLEENDYIRLDDIDKSSKVDCHKIIDHANGEMKKGYVSLCKYCMGCGSDNQNVITAGVQM